MNHHLIPEVIRQELVAPHELHLGPMTSGGLSGAWIWRCQSPRGPVALRGWPTVHPTPERLSQIHAAMRSARQQGLLSIPAVFSNRQGESFTGDGQRLWELTQWMPGTADYHRAPSTQRLQSAVRAVANLHVAWRAACDSTSQSQWVYCSSKDATLLATSAGASASNSAGPSVGLSPTVAERRQKLELSLQRLQAWRSRCGGSTVYGSSISTGSIIGDPQAYTAAVSGLAQQTLVHLAARGPALLQELIEVQRVLVPLHFVLRDVWSDHILFTEDRVTGIIDFGAARVDEPATDVARLLGSLEPLDASRWLIGWQAYHADNPRVDLERVRLLDRVGTLLAAVQWLQWLAIEPRQFDMPIQQLLLRWQRLLQRLDASC